MQLITKTSISFDGRHGRACTHIRTHADTRKCTSDETSESLPLVMGGGGGAARGVAGVAIRHGRLWCCVRRLWS